MLLPHIDEFIDNYRIILASASTNRKEILKNVGLYHDK